MILLPAGMGLAPSHSGGAVTYATLNPSDKSANVVLSGGDLTMHRATGGTSDEMVRATLGKAAGRWYYEVTSPQARGLAPADGLMVGLEPSGSSLTGGFPGHDATGSVGLQWRRYAAVGDGIINYENNVPTTTSILPTATTANAYIGVAFHATGSAVLVWIIVDGVWFSGQSPVSHPGGRYSLAQRTYFPALSSAYPIGTYPTASQTANFGASPFKVGAVFGIGGVLEGFNPGVYV